MPTWTLPSYLAAQKIEWNAMLLFGGLLLFGLLGGQLVSRLRFVPRLSGYLLAGAALGAGGFNLLSGDVLELANIFADLAVALIVYQLGRYVDIAWLKREKWLVLTVCGSAMLCFLFVSALLESLGAARNLAMLAGIFAIGTGPAVVMIVVRDLQAEGQLTRRLAAMSALNNLVALLAAYVLLPAIANETRTPWLTQVSHTLYSLCGAVLLASITHRVLILLARLLGRDRHRQFVLVIAAITLIVGATHALQLPVLLTMLAFSILSKNLDAKYELMELEFGHVSELLTMVLFVTIGASLHWGSLKAIGLSVAAFVVARMAAIGCGILAFARPAHLSLRQAGWLALASLPMTEAGLGLIQISNLYPHTIAEIAPLLAGSLIVMEIIGPIATHFALLRSGESQREA